MRSFLLKMRRPRREGRRDRLQPATRGHRPRLSALRARPVKRPGEAAFPGASQGRGRGKHQRVHRPGLWRACPHRAWTEGSGPPVDALISLRARGPGNRDCLCASKMSSLQILVCDRLQLPSKDAGSAAGMALSTSGWRGSGRLTKPEQRPQRAQWPSRSPDTT